MPFIIGGVLAYVICPICNFFDNIYNKVFKFIKNEKKRKACPIILSVFTGLLIAILFIYFMIIVIIPNLVNSVVRLIQIILIMSIKLLILYRSFLTKMKSL